MAKFGRVVLVYRDIDGEAARYLDLPRRILGPGEDLADVVAWANASAAAYAANSGRAWDSVTGVDLVVDVHVAEIYEEDITAPS